LQDSIVLGTDILEKLRAEDLARRSPLQVPPEMVEKASPEIREKIRKIQFEHEKLRQVIVCGYFKDVFHERG